MSGVQKKFACTLCNASFDRRDGLKRHWDTIHRKKRWGCENCTFQYQSVSGARDHSINTGHKLYEYFSMNPYPDTQQTFEEAYPTLCRLPAPPVVVPFTGPPYCKCLHFCSSSFYFHLLIFCSYVLTQRFHHPFLLYSNHWQLHLPLEYEFVSLCLLSLFFSVSLPNSIFFQWLRRLYVRLFYLRLLHHL